MRHVFLISLFVFSLVSNAYEKDDVVLMLTSNEAEKIEESLAFLNQQAQSKIRGKPGQDIDSILEPAREYLAPYQEHLLSVDLVEYPKAVYLIGLSSPNEKTANVVLAYAESGEVESIGLALTALASMNYNQPETIRLIRDTLGKTQHAQNYRLAAEMALKWELTDLIPQIRQRVQSDNTNVQRASESILERFELLITEEAEEPVVEVAPAPVVEEVAEVIEEVTAPEPATKEPAELVVTEPIQEDVEQSPNWTAWLADRWLWLIGAVVVVGGVFLLRPRK